MQSIGISKEEAIELFKGGIVEMVLECRMLSKDMDKKKPLKE